ncbi:Sec-independent protein translocase subunit TatA/TatB [Synechocystis salina]|nr:twin-arginine translocase TatA/TatE family subunit [Synechocystis salina]
MFGLGWPEILLILGVVIIIFGPKRIPELGGALGKTAGVQRGVADPGCG